MKIVDYIYVFVCNSERIIMGIEQIMMVEIQGLSKTIKEYSNDNYIISYADQLLTIKYPDDKMKFSLLVNRIYDWYKEEIAKIKSSEYVLAKASHIKSYQIITELRELLDENQVF